MYKVKIVTFFSDEKSLDYLKKKLALQEKIHFDHIVLEGLSLEKANQKFFEIVVGTELNFDYVLKLDADMLPSATNSIFLACNLANSLSVSRLTLQLYDLYTRSFINGIHLISTKNLSCLQLIGEFPSTDIWINKINGISIKHSRKNLFFHGVLPTHSQLIRFGFQRGRKLKRSSYSHGHWQTAQLILKNIKKKENKKNQLIFLGLLIGLGMIQNDLTKTVTVNNIKSLSADIESMLDESEVLTAMQSAKDTIAIFPSESSLISKIKFLISLRIYWVKDLLIKFIHQQKYKL